MTNFVKEYIRDFGKSHEIQYTPDPFLELSDYHLGKIVFTGDKIRNLNTENLRDLYEKLQSELGTIDPKKILVISLKQGVGTKDPLYTLYIFHIETFILESIEDKNTLYELNPAGIPKKIIKIEEKEIELPIQNNREKETSKSQTLSLRIIEKLKQLLMRR